MRGPGARSIAWRLAGSLIAVALLVPFAATPASAGGGDAVTLSGTLGAVIADDFLHGRSETRYALDTAKGRVPLVVRGDGPPAISGRRVTISGTRLADGRVLVESARPAADDAPTGGATGPIAAAPYGWPGPGVRHVAVVIGTYTNQTTPVGTAGEALEALTGAGASVNTFFETASRGRVTVDATVLGTWALGFDSCSSRDPFTDSINAVVTRANAAGINLSVYDHVIMWTPAACGGDWVALGEAPGQFVQMNAAYPDAPGDRVDSFANVASHEMGHNLGLLHANALACTSGATPVALSSTCSAIEYGDPFSTMGGDGGIWDPGNLDYAYLSPLFDSAELAHLGWLDADEEQVVTGAGSYHLVATYGNDDGVRLLRIRRTTPPVGSDPSMRYVLRSGWLTIELRSEPPGGPFDSFLADSPVLSGVIVRYVEDGFDWSGYGYLPALGSTYLVDTEPATVGSSYYDADLHDAPLAVGDTLTDPVTGAQVTLASLGTTGAEVTISFTGSNPPAAPQVAAPTVTGLAPASGSVTVDWAAPTTHAAYPPEAYTVRSYPGGQACVAVPAYMPNSCTVTGLANGTAYRFTVTAETSGGYWQMSLPSDPATPLGPPVARVLPLSTWRASQSIAVSWDGEHDGQPVDAYDVRYRAASWSGSFGAYATWQSATVAANGTITGATGRTYCFSARAHHDGVTGPWSAEACTAVPLDDRSLKRSSAWSAITGTAYYRSTAVRATKRGASITRTHIEAKRVALVASTCPTCGSVKVYWNGSYKKTVNLRSSTAKNRAVISILSFSSIRSGTLKLVVSSSGKRVTVDGVATSRR